MQEFNEILGSELEIDTELTEAQMELICGGKGVVAATSMSQEAPIGRSLQGRTIIQVNKIIKR